MKKTVFAVAGLVVVLAGMAYAGVLDTFASGTWRYKMTVVVETPEGDKTGSAVREVRVQRGLRLTPEMMPHIEVSGEAVVIDLGERGILFALLRGGFHGQDYASDILFDVFPSPVPALSTEGIRYYDGLKPGTRAVLKPEQYPMFVRFKDLKDPRTVEAVSAINTEDKKYGFKNDVIRTAQSAFGKGVRVKAVEIEATRERINWDIDKKLEWLNKLNGGYLHGGSTSRGAPLGLYGGDFRKGGK